MKHLIIIPYVKAAYGSLDTIGVALMSIRRYFPEDYEVIVVGKKPEDIEDDDKVRWMDIRERGESQHTDMVRRILAALESKGDDKPDEFILWHDDMFQVGGLDIEHLRRPHAIKDVILSAPASDNYYLRDMHYTLEEIRKAGITYIFNYTIHCPVMYDTQKFLRLVEDYGLRGRPLDFEMLYFNLHHRDPEVLDSGNNAWRLTMSDTVCPPLERPVFIALNNKFSNREYLERVIKRIKE